MSSRLPVDQSVISREIHQLTDAVRKLTVMFHELTGVVHETFEKLVTVVNGLRAEQDQQPLVLPMHPETASSHKDVPLNEDGSLFLPVERPAPEASSQIAPGHAGASASVATSAAASGLCAVTSEPATAASGSATTTAFGNAERRPCTPCQKWRKRDFSKLGKDYDNNGSCSFCRRKLAEGKENPKCFQSCSQKYKKPRTS